MAENYQPWTWKIPEDFSPVDYDAPRHDAHDKLSGQAVFTRDLDFPGMLYAKILTSPYAHARIININTSRAESVSGVEAVVTMKDVPKKQYTGEIINFLNDSGISSSGVYDVRVFDDKVRYVGDAVAAVAAVDEKVAEEALELINVEYEPLPAVFDPMEAIKEDAPQIHEGVELNINVTRHIEWGDVDEAFQHCDHIREDQFKCSSQAHVCMETHDAVASFGYDGSLTVWT